MFKNSNYCLGQGNPGVDATALRAIAAWKQQFDSSNERKVPGVSQLISFGKANGLPVKYGPAVSTLESDLVNLDTSPRLLCVKIFEF